MLRGFCILCFLVSLFGCVTFKDQLKTLKPGMIKTQVDEILEDQGKWIGNIDSEKGVRSVWGYPKESFGLNTMFVQDTFVRYYLFFEENKFIEYANTFSIYKSKPGTTTPSGVSGPASLSGGGMGGGPVGMYPGGR